MRAGGLRVHVGGARGARERPGPEALHGLVQRGHGAGGDARHVDPSAGVLVDADAALAAAGLRGGRGKGRSESRGASGGRPQRVARSIEAIVTDLLLFYLLYSVFKRFEFVSY